eukprot:gene8010-5568_t
MDWDFVFSSVRLENDVAILDEKREGEVRTYMLTRPQCFAWLSRVLLGQPHIPYTNALDRNTYIYLSRRANGPIRIQDASRPRHQEISCMASQQTPQKHLRRSSGRWPRRTWCRAANDSPMRRPFPLDCTRLHSQSTGVLKPYSLRTAPAEIDEIDDAHIIQQLEKPLLRPSRTMAHTDNTFFQKIAYPLMLSLLVVLPSSTTMNSTWTLLSPFSGMGNNSSVPPKGQAEAAGPEIKRRNVTFTERNSTTFNPSASGAHVDPNADVRCSTRRSYSQESSREHYSTSSSRSSSSYSQESSREASSASSSPSHHAHRSTAGDQLTNDERLKGEKMKKKNGNLDRPVSTKFFEKCKSAGIDNPDDPENKETLKDFLFCRIRDAGDPQLVSEIYEVFSQPCPSLLTITRQIDEKIEKRNEAVLVQIALSALQDLRTTVRQGGISDVFWRFVEEVIKEAIDRELETHHHGDMFVPARLKNLKGSNLFQDSNTSAIEKTNVWKILQKVENEVHNKHSVAHIDHKISSGIFCEKLEEMKRKYKTLRESNAQPVQLARELLVPISQEWSRCTDKRFCLLLDRAGFDCVTDSELAMQEIKMRQMGESLFEGNPQYPQVKGLCKKGGIPPPVRSMIDEISQWLRINQTGLNLVAKLSLDGEMASSFFNGEMASSFLYACEKKTCPCTVLLVSLLTESTSIGKLSVAKRAALGLGCGGSDDHWTLLNRYHSEVQRDSEHQSFFQQIKSRLEKLIDIISYFPEVQLPDKDKTGSVTREQVMDALTAGHWRSIAAFNRWPCTSVGFHKAYYVLSADQTTTLGCSISPPEPPFLLVTNAARGADTSQVTAGFVSWIPETLLWKHIPQHEKVVRTVTLDNEEYQCCKAFLEPCCSGPISVVTVRQNGGSSGYAVSFHADRVVIFWMLSRIASVLGSRSDPSLMKKTVQTTLDTYGRTYVSVDQLKRMHLEDVVNRVNKIQERRTEHDLKSCLNSSDAGESLGAFLNIVFHYLEMDIKGGIVRDYVCAGLKPGQSLKDVDTETRQCKWTVDNWENVLKKDLETLRSKFGIELVNGPRIGHGAKQPRDEKDGMVRFSLKTPKNGVLEVEAVAPWNTGYIPCRSTDFSVNNLAVQEWYKGITLNSPILLSAVEVVRQIRCYSKAFCCPCQDSKFKDGGTDGWSGKLTVVHTSIENGQKKRIEHIKGKNFTPVEGSYIADNAKQGLEPILVLFSGVKDAHVATACCATQTLRPEERGDYGPALSLVRDPYLAQEHYGKHVLRVEIFLPCCDPVMFEEEPDADWLGGAPLARGKSLCANNVGVVCFSRKCHEVWAVRDTRCVLRVSEIHPPAL